MDLDTFLRDENIRRYRRLVDSSIGSFERQMILKLLAEEMAKLKSKHHEKTSPGMITSKRRANEQSVNARSQDQAAEAS